MCRLLRLAAVPSVFLLTFTAACHKRVAANAPPLQREEAPKKAAPPPRPPNDEIGRTPGPPEIERSTAAPPATIVGPAPPTRSVPPPSEATPQTVPPRSHARRVTAHRHTEPVSAAPTPQPESDAARPRKLVLAPGAPPNSAAYKFDSPALQQGQMARFRLLVDPNPTYTQQRPPGTTDGTAVPLSSPLDASLTTEQPGLTVVAEDQARRDVLPQQSVEWFWDVTPSNSGKASLRLDLSKIVNGEKVPLDGFPIHTDFAVASPQSTGAQSTETQSTAPPPPPQPSHPGFPFWWLAVGTFAAAAAWFIFLRRGRKPEPAPSIGTATAQRTILQKEDSYVFVIDVLTIYYATDQARLQTFCRQIADERYRFNVGIAGFAAGSPRWQQWFTDSLAACDAILVVLTGDSLGEKWLNWQLDKARAAQNEREIPLYVAALDEQVLKVARTVQLLEGITCYPPTPEGQAELKASLRGSELASTRNLRCFISYSHSHREFANRICADLNHAGIRTWMDVEGIPGGATWKQAIAKAIESSSHVLFVLTAESVKSDQVANEIDWAQQKKKTIIPVMENEVDLPFGLLGTQYISFTQGYDSGFRRLLQDLVRSAPAKKAAGA